MRIEEAIKQKKPFRSAWDRAQVNLIFTHNWMVSKMKSEFKPYGLTMNQYNVLRILRGAGKPITTSLIRERLLDRMADASRLVDRLHQKDLVNRQVCPTDKRLVDVSLTRKGFDLLARIDEKHEKLNSPIKKLTEEEADQLNALLNKIRKE